MRSWPKHPLIYEINTWVWLDEQCALTLASVPDAEWDGIAALGFDAVWLMGVWERSPAGIRISMANDGLLAQFRLALPDFTERDNVGSPYCVRRYAVDAHLGGDEALAIARNEIARRGMRLILDLLQFPNGMAGPSKLLESDLVVLAKWRFALPYSGESFRCSLPGAGQGSVG
jgi:hypothetical protein